MSLGFLDHMRVVPDHRIPGMVIYPLDELLLATLVGVVCGADDWNSGSMQALRRFGGDGGERTQTLPVGMAFGALSVTRSDMDRLRTRATDPASCLRPCRRACET